MRLLVAALCWSAAFAQGLFDYDREKLPPLECEELASRPDVRLQGCGFAAPRGGKLNLVLVSPKNVRPPYAGVIYQHGGGQSMNSYLSEATILARAGVVSMLTDAPARGEGAKSELNELKLDEARRHQADIVVVLRMALEHLQRQPGVDGQRVAYVGHIYGRVAGGTLAGVERRLRTFVLLGAVPGIAEHVRVNSASYWQEMRNRLTDREFTQPLAMIRETDPANFLPAATAPVLVQCAKFDTPDNVKGCPEVHALAGGPKELKWYDDDHHFSSWEAPRDRLGWLERHLALRGVKARAREFWKR